MGEPPRVSVLIGAYNNAATLPRAIDSILSQTLADLEVIVIDDGSKDHTAEVARSAADADPRIRVLALEANVGISRSLNLGIAEARAPVVAVQDADDYSEPQRLQRQLDALEADDEIAVVGCRMREVDERGRELVPRTKFAAGDVAPVLLSFNPIPNGCSAFRRETVLELGGYDPRYRYAMEHDLWLRAAERWRIVALDELLATRVMGTSNVAARAERSQTAETFLIRARTLRRRRTLRGVTGLILPAVSYVVPLGIKRARRVRLGQAP